jgi:hypothetical protein
MLDGYKIDAEVSQEVQTKYGVAYRVKVLVRDHGFFINGMMVYPPNADHPEWAVLPPGMPRQPGKFVVEFNKKLPLWSEIEEKCLEVAKDVVVEEIPDGPISFDNIPGF